jgi:serine/threonine protein kinase
MKHLQFKQKSDIWSLAVCFIAIFTKEFPFEGETDENSRELVLNYDLDEFYKKFKLVQQPPQSVATTFKFK